jgi:phosphatidylserine decarboxylase
MEIFSGMVFGTLILVMAMAMAGLYLFWRYVWFFRNPERRIPQGEQILSPADGTVVYAERVAPDEPLISIKKGKRIFVSDILHEDVSGTKYHIGVFMSPFDVHFNRAPLTGVIDFIRHYPAKRKNLHMSSMHWRTLRKRLPLYKNSLHIMENERTVTKISGHFKGDPLSCYVVQIAGGSVDGIDTFVPEGNAVLRGRIFGMIRIGSQVDTVVTGRESMTIKVKPGDRVKAGQTVLIE